MAEKKKDTGKKPSEDSSANQSGLALPIQWHFPEGLVGRYANQALVQYGPNECYLSFFEVAPPVLFGTPEEMREQAKSLKAIRAECVARVVVAHEFVPSLIRILQETVERHQSSATQPDGSGGRS
jgi:hypothetical protein